MATPLRRSARSLLLVTALAAGLTACDQAAVPTASPTPTPSPTATPPVATTPSPAGSPTSSPARSPDGTTDPSVYLEINEQVQQIRGLEERQPVEPQIVSEEELAEVLRRTVREEAPPELLEAYESLYKAMGLMPADESLADVYLELLESQVGGLYQSSDDSLYVLSREGEVGPLEQTLYAHEYQHALQDQHFDLEAFQPADLIDETDMQMARQALVEGDAYVLMTLWLQQNLSPFEIGEVLAAGNDPEALATLQRIPPIVSSQILFPATQGLVFVLGIQTQGGWEAVDAAFADPPQSTEQVLHPEKWASREPPIEVDLPDDLPDRLGEGWTVTLEDSLGEQQIAVWLTGEAPTGGMPSAPPAGAAGWGGDRLTLLSGPDEAWALAIATEWDTPGDADEFESAIRPRLSEAGGPAEVLAGEADASRWVLIGSDEETLAALRGELDLPG